MEKKVKYTVKDSSRYYWEINAERIGEAKDSFDKDDPDYVWKWTITREDKAVNFTGEFTGQYNEVPQIQEILLLFMQEITSMVIDFSRYGVLKSRS